MPPARSRSGRTLTPSAKNTKYNPANVLHHRGKDIKAKKTAPKSKQAQRVPTPSSSAESDEEQISQVTRQHVKPPKAPIDVRECKYTVNCVTVFSDRKFNQDSGSFHLGDFKVHEYDAKAINAVQTYAANAKLGYELESALAVVSAPRVKQLTKTINDPSDWESLEGLIEDYMKAGYRFLRVDYTVTYSKAPRRVIAVEIEDSDDGDEDNGPARKRTNGNTVSPA